MINPENYLPGPDFGPLDPESLAQPPMYFNGASDAYAHAQWRGREVLPVAAPDRLNQLAEDIAGLVFTRRSQENDK